MVEKGQYVKLTVDPSHKLAPSYPIGYRDAFIYIGKGIVGDDLLFVTLSDHLAPRLIPADAILNVELFENNYYDKRVKDSGIVDEGSDEKFKHWLTCLENKDSHVPRDLYYTENRLAFKLFSLEQFKLYFSGDTCKRKMLAYILERGLSADNLDKFYGHHECIARCIRNLKPETEHDLELFIDFTNKALKKDKRATGLTNQESSYFYRLDNAIENGADYNDYPRSKVKPALMKRMWDSHYCMENQVRVFASLLRSDLDVEDVLYLVAHAKHTLCELTVHQLYSLLESFTNLAETLKLLALISKYNATGYKNKYLGEMNLESVTKAYDLLLESRKPKVDLTKKVDANSLFN